MTFNILESIKFDQKGLVTAVAINQKNGQIIMLAHMNKQALQKTIATKMMYYWSRSRQELWFKGGTSGNTQKVTRIRIDCDGDALLFEVIPQGMAVACHNGYHSCFYRELQGNNSWEIIDGLEPLFDPKKVYQK